VAELSFICLVIARSLIPLMCSANKYSNISHYWFQDYIIH